MKRMPHENNGDKSLCDCLSASTTQTRPYTHGEDKNQCLFVLFFMVLTCWFYSLFKEWTLWTFQGEEAFTVLSYWFRQYILRETQVFIYTIWQNVLSVLKIEDYVIFILFITSLIIFTDLLLLMAFVPYIMLENKIYLTQWLCLALHS